MNFKKIFALSAAAVLALSMTACGNKDDDDDEESTPDYEVPVEAFVKNIKNFDSGVKNKIFLDEELDYILENVFDGDKNDMDDYIEDMFSDLDDDFSEEFGSDYRLSYEVAEKEKFDDDDLDEATDYYNTYFDDEDFEVDNGYILDVTMTLKVDDKNYQSEWEFNVVEVDGDWCLLDWDDYGFELVGEKGEEKAPAMNVVDDEDIENMDYEDVLQAVPME